MVDKNLILHTYLGDSDPLVPVRRRMDGHKALSRDLCFLLLWVLLELGEAELHRVRTVGVHHIQLGIIMV